MVNPKRAPEEDDKILLKPSLSVQFFFEDSVCM
jgi:hypothetical protein